MKKKKQHKHETLIPCIRNPNTQPRFVLFFPQWNCTCTEIATRAAGVSLQQHTCRGHLCPKSSLDVVNKILTVRTVHPDSFPQRVLNVHLETHSGLTYCKTSYMATLKRI